MLDPVARSTLRRPLGRAARTLDRPWVTPDRITVFGLVLGVSAAVAAGSQWWAAALLLWLMSRVADGVDGALARRRQAASQATNSGAGGFLDITVDFVVYGAFVVGVAVGWGGSLLPFLVVLFTYYINGATFLAFSSIAEHTGRQRDDGRSLSFLGGLAGGTETIVVHSLWCIFPTSAGSVAWVWAIVVGISATQRVVGGYRALR